MRPLHFYGRRPELVEFIFSRRTLGVRSIAEIRIETQRLGSERFNSCPALLLAACVTLT